MPADQTDPGEHHDDPLYHLCVPCSRSLLRRGMLPVTRDQAFQQVSTAQQAVGIHSAGPGTIHGHYRAGEWLFDFSQPGRGTHRCHGFEAAVEYLEGFPFVQVTVEAETWTETTVGRLRATIRAIF